VRAGQRGLGRADRAFGEGLQGNGAPTRARHPVVEDLIDRASVVLAIADPDVDLAAISGESRQRRTANRVRDEVRDRIPGDAVALRRVAIDRERELVAGALGRTVLREPEHAVQTQQLGLHGLTGSGDALVVLAVDRHRERIVTRSIAVAELRTLGP